MKGELLNRIQSPKLQSPDHCPPKKLPHKGAEISLETLEILLTSVPDEEITLSSNTVSKTNTLHSQRQNIDKVIAHKQHYQKRLNYLMKRKHGAEWLYRNLSYFQTQFPWELISLLENMAHETTPDITCKTPKPINELRQLSDSSVQPDSPVVHQLAGLQILAVNIRRYIFNSLEDPLNKLSTEAINKFTLEELDIWNNWCINIESNINQIDQLLYAGQLFFSIENFKLMDQLPLSESSKSALTAIVNKINPI